MIERFIVDTAGTLIDMETRNTYDYVSDVVGLLNGYDNENEQLKADKQSLIDFIKKEFPKSHKHILEGFE